MKVYVAETENLTGASRCSRCSRGSRGSRRPHSLWYDAIRPRHGQRFLRTVFLFLNAMPITHRTRTLFSPHTFGRLLAAAAFVAGFSFFFFDAAPLFVAFFAFFVALFAGALRSLEAGGRDFVFGTLGTAAFRFAFGFFFGGGGGGALASSASVSTL